MHSSTDNRDSGPIAGSLDEQQTLVLAALRRARGGAVSYQELRDAGVEYPASVVSELELAGYPLERTHRRSPHPTIAVALDPRAEQGAASLRDGLDRGHPAEASRGERVTPRGPSHGTRWLAPGALLVTAVVVAAALAGSLAGSSSRRPASPRRSHAPDVASGPVRSGASKSGTSASPGSAQAAEPLPRTVVSPALAAQLDARGHALLEAGEAAAAVPVLRQTLAATGESLGSCVEPVTEQCLLYAYALYDLGRALQLGHRAAAAVPVLERRLEIANQRATVQGELEVARAQAGRAASAPATPG